MSTLRFKGRFSKRSISSRIKKLQEVRKKCGDAGQSQLHGENTDFSTPKTNSFPVHGRRIIDIKYLSENMTCAACKAPLLMQNISGELIRGLGGWFTVDCTICRYKTQVSQDSVVSVKK